MYSIFAASKSFVEIGRIIPPQRVSGSANVPSGVNPAEKPVAVVHHNYKVRVLPDNTLNQMLECLLLVPFLRLFIRKNFLFQFPV
jgi:hypothetical protein